MIESRWLVLGAAVFVAACGNGVVDTTGSGGATATGPSGPSGTSTTSTGSLTTTTATGLSATSGGSTSSSGGGGASSLPDPNVDGPYTFAELDSQYVTTASGNTVAVHVAHPTAGPTSGPYPVVVIAHGFQLPGSQYYGYAKRLASFGYVAIVPDYPAGFTGVNNVKNAQDLVFAIDWAAAKPELAGQVDVMNVGMTGHSMGGKLAILAASMDSRVRASITLDPVDSSMSCNPTDCPDASSLTGSLGIPTGYIGETTDATAGGFGQACAPAADNFTTFYSGAATPSLEVTVLGANHMSFLDSVATCGFICSFCNAATAQNAPVNALSKAMVTAFYERHLRNITGYDSFLTGADAQARYVGTGQATIVSK